MTVDVLIPTPAVVVLIGPSGSGKSTWAETHFRPGQILSADAFRALTGSGEDDQTAGGDAFDLLDQLLTLRLAKGLTTVIDTTGLDADRRAAYREQAVAAGVSTVAIGFDTDPALCHERNADRPGPIPKTVLDKQLRQWRKVKVGLEEEGFDRIMINPGPPRLVPKDLATSAPDGSSDSVDAVGEDQTLAFDLVVSSFDFDGGMPETLTAIAAAAEEAGFRSLWLMDHFRQIPQIGRAWDPMLEPYTALAYLAARTTTLRLGTLVTGIEHRNVGLLSKIIATLDVLSGGRAECGIGAGWFDAEQAAYGYPVNSNRVRLDTLEDALQALPLLWGPGSKSFSGTVVSVPEAMGYPRPIQDPLPILVGGGGERRTLRLAARYADACNITGPVDVIEHKIDVVRGHCRDLDRDPDDLTITTLNPLIHATDGPALADLVGRLRPRNRSADAFAAATNAATTEYHVARFRQLADLGVGRACVALTGNSGPDRVREFGAVIDAFRA
ncbi:MAG: TIGR03560 family F420-dependent LLM class oxidoreductase [Actinomycetota bacterium]